jgi:hypothetical protein
MYDQLSFLCGGGLLASTLVAAKSHVKIDSLLDTE